MPEGYTHIRTARRAAKMAQLPIGDKAAFGCGANGPDILFCYRVWRPGEERGENLPKIGSRLHDENTGLFLQTLLENAVTPSQKSYVMGFLSHYATDCTVHPYIVMLTQKGQPYAQKGGHGYSEIAIDSWLHEKDTGSPAVPVDHNTPALVGAALAQVGALLQTGIERALGITVSREALADTFWHTRNLRRLFTSRFKIKYAIFWLAEPLFGGRGFITGHITPRALSGTKKGTKPLPCPWQNPFTGQTETDNLEALLEKAERRSAAYMLAAQGYWQGRLPLEKVMGLLGSASYLSGLPDERSAPGRLCNEQPEPQPSAAVSQPEQQPQTGEAQPAQI